MKIAVFAGLALGATMFGSTAQAQDDYIGEIFMTGANFCPRDTTEANGQLLPIAQNTALFSLYGTIYGGDGRTTFALPDLRGAAPIHAGRPVGGSDVPMGAKRVLPAGESEYAQSRELAIKYCVVMTGVYPSRN